MFGFLALIMNDIDNLIFSRSANRLRLCLITKYVVFFARTVIKAAGNSFPIYSHLNVSMSPHIQVLREAGLKILCQNQN